jgi:hypothetical protein
MLPIGQRLVYYHASFQSGIFGVPKPLGNTNLKSEPDLSAKPTEM